METIKLSVTDAYVLGDPATPVTELHVESAGNSLVLLFAYDETRRVGGLRLTVEDMDKLAQEWIKARRLCPFCQEPFMDAPVDEQPEFENVSTRWECDHCGGAVDTTWEPGDVAWVDPIGETRCT